MVAIGAPFNGGNGGSSGQVRVYEYVNNEWSQRGSDLDGEAGGDNSGYSVSLSSDGSVVAIGAIYNDGNGSNSGHVRVYEFETQIEKNKRDIATNVADIATNKADIGTNLTTIQDHEGRIQTNEGKIATNETNIGTNLTTIQDHEARIATNEDKLNKIITFLTSVFGF